MSALGQLAQRVPRTPRVRTTICTLAMVCVGVAVYALVPAAGPVAQLIGLQAHEVSPQQFLVAASLFAMGVTLLHVGHCAESARPE